MGKEVECSLPTHLPSSQGNYAFQQCHHDTDAPLGGPPAGSEGEQTPRECDGGPLKSKGRKKMDMEEKVKVFISSGN